MLAFPLGWLILFFLVPVGFVVAYSVGALAVFPGDQGFSLTAWRAFFGSSIYISLFFKSLQMAAIAAGAAVALAYPIAYYLALIAKKHRYLLLLILLAPAFTSFLLRVIAWKVLLGDQGAINSFTYWLGLRPDGHPIPFLLYSQVTVILVLLYAWMPFAALPIFVTLERLDRRLLEAAADLGATRRQAFVKVVFPLSLPGVFAALIFVFIASVGEFVIPSLVGGATGYMYGNAVADLFGPAFDWKTGSTLAVFLLLVVLLFAAAGAAVIAIAARYRRLGLR